MAVGLSADVHEVPRYIFCLGLLTLGHRMPFTPSGALDAGLPVQVRGAAAINCCVVYNAGPSMQTLLGCGGAQRWELSSNIEYHITPFLDVHRHKLRVNSVCFTNYIRKCHESELGSTIMLLHNSRKLYYIYKGAPYAHYYSIGG